MPGSYLLKGKKVGSIPAIAFSLCNVEIEDEGGDHDEDGAENGSNI
jgi:hypothetical protein